MDFAMSHHPSPTHHEGRPWSSYAKITGKSFKRSTDCTMLMPHPFSSRPDHQRSFTARRTGAAGGVPGVVTPPNRWPTKFDWLIDTVTDFPEIAAVGFDHD